MQVRHLATAGIVVLIILTLGWTVARWRHRSQPEYVLEMIDQIRSKEDLARVDDYFTPQGRDIFLWAMEKTGDTPMTGTKGKYSTPAVNGDVCDIGLRSKDGSGTVRLLKTDHWRFHDLYFDKSQGKDIGLWASYVKDHPYATAWTLMWR